MRTSDSPTTGRLFTRHPLRHHRRRHRCPATSPGLRHCVKPSIPAIGTKTTLYNFGAEPDGQISPGALLYHAGLLYGVTTDGGYGYGTVFSINPKTKVETVVYCFLGKADAVGPWSGVIYRDGFLYGTSGGGGANGMVAVIWKLIHCGRTEIRCFGHSFTEARSNFPSMGSISKAVFDYSRRQFVRQTTIPMAALRMTASYSRSTC